MSGKENYLRDNQGYFGISRVIHRVKKEKTFSTVQVTIDRPGTNVPQHSGICKGKTSKVEVLRPSTHWDKQEQKLR